MKTLLSILSLFCVYNLSAQNIYVVKQTQGAATYEVFQLIVDPDTSLVFQFKFAPTGDCKDIAISPSGKLYGTGVEGLYEINKNDGTTTDLGQIPQTGLYTSLVCSNDNFLYTLNLNGHLYKYDITNASFELVTQLPGGSPGDLSFYKGNLIFQSSWDGNIKAFNLENESLLTIYCMPEPLNTSKQSFFGLSNNADICESLSFIASSTGNDFYEIDIENDTIKHLKVNNPILSLKTLFLGTASNTEHFSSDCSFQFEAVACEPMEEKRFFVLGKTLSEKVYHIYSLNQDQSLNFEFEFYSEFGCKDIAYTSLGFLYGIGTSTSPTLFKINSISHEVQELVNYPINTTIEAIVSGESSQIYSIDQDGKIYIYDLICNDFSLATNLSQHAPTTDLAFKENTLIFQSKKDGNIKALNLLNFKFSNILCVAPPYNELSTGGFVGIANYFQDCDLNILTGFTSENKMYELNFGSDSIYQTQSDLVGLAPNVRIQGTAFKNDCATTTINGTFTDIICLSSLKNIEENTDITVFPNPAEDIISISSNFKINQVIIYDLHGKIWKKSDAQSIHIENLAQGIYFLQIQTDHGKVVRKMIKN